MNTEVEKLKAAMVSKYEEMTPSQIADDVWILIDKAVAQGFNSGFELAKSKAQGAIADWQRDEIIKALL